MAEVGLMIEAQEGLDWPRWRQIVRDAERLGFASLRTSDHCFSVMGQPTRSLSAWPALALAAEWSERLKLAPMVSPLTFYHPAILARTARAVDELSGGRVLLGVGTGWYQAEHEAFGIPFPSQRERFDNLERGLDRIQQTLADHPLPILIGGGGPKRTIPLAARFASEWNFMEFNVEGYRAKSALLDDHCRQLGREPSEIRRSLMLGYLLGRNDAELRERAVAMGKVRGWPDKSPDEVLTELRERRLVGTPQEAVAQLRPFIKAGVQEFCFQTLLLDDREALELIAQEVMPALQ
ncbi:MAG: LLM class flavin-dependent oxidoreductase [Candidatus Dormibacter sp.]|uniref:LLM class flavin-dependent oxidoreductase n=1 Tax=Candidatus Dormibacter sp. TaxID=2973982 RepID=UPI0026BFB0E4